VVDVMAIAVTVAVAVVARQRLKKSFPNN